MLASQAAGRESTSLASQGRDTSRNLAEAGTWPVAVTQMDAVVEGQLGDGWDNNAENVARPATTVAGTTSGMEPLPGSAVWEDRRHGLSTSSAAGETASGASAGDAAGLPHRATGGDGNPLGFAGTVTANGVLEWSHFQAQRLGRINEMDCPLVRLQAKLQLALPLAMLLAFPTGQLAEMATPLASLEV